MINANPVLIKLKNREYSLSQLKDIKPIIGNPKVDITLDKVFRKKLLDTDKLRSPFDSEDFSNFHTINL